MNRLAVIYDELGILDSSDYYITGALNYTKFLPKQLKANFYANTGAYYYNSNKLDSAEKYILMSIKAKPTARANYILGVIYMEMGRKAEAWKLCEKAAADGELRHQG
mgnify:FL=1